MAREQAVLAATAELLAERGYQALTTDAVAARAGASKATIYRRWANKAQLVRASLDAADAARNAAVPDTGALRSDLLAVMDVVAASVADPLTRVTAELATLMRHDEQLAEAIRQHLDKEELSPFHDPLRRAISRGDIAADTDAELIHDVAEAMILRQMHLDRPIDPVFSARLIDDVLLVLLGVR
ncbi:TetR/AcrR family transcriptional regulator [Mycobacterium sp. CBMA293]|uniref:TetR/AcrR family transcriptional regulator n=1 Tax=unclassified Mycolicibacterium TaxID=2636767 RepID=UPI0012DE768A|nr:MULTISPECIES: TetR/AcrR family transcriptional regulator [unclassified Mycolicibacterium]MUL45189.1 TetR/AcrR family transcriptional regulator [Mycolicibacterium sp. CBMA 360]MUL56708.1 TetR/AcrR family transcriptional regulator [Mycolicibacterium sp. CBMA 335]MUL69747.1 TetR/AcrR family transcriptional regulator [Mycolicibacterium sp. CBMA 311]MUL91795.1 TetR/AcrR family transcriptional regulator [Mycolicibacterium sp. CBMA 230]MUM05535.1 TetR family transcriptional regulator [Mycolicibact